MKKASYETILNGFISKGGTLAPGQIFVCYLNNLSEEGFIDFGTTLIENCTSSSFLSNVIFVSIPKVKNYKQFTPKIYEKYTKYLDYKIKYLQMKKKMTKIEKDFE